MVSDIGSFLILVMTPGDHYGDPSSAKSCAKWHTELEKMLRSTLKYQITTKKLDGELKQNQQEIRSCPQDTNTMKSKASCDANHEVK